MSAAASIYIYPIHHRVSHDFIGSRNCVPMASTAESPLCPNIITAVLLLYILWTRFPPPTYVCTSVEGLVYTVQYHMLCFKTYQGTMYYCCTYYEPVFTPPTYACQRVRNLLYTVQYHMLCFKTQLLLLYCRLVFPLPTFVRTRNSLYVRCMESHTKTSMLIVEKRGMLHILKLVC